MKADDIRFSEILNISEGMLDLHGRRLVLHSMDAFAQFRKDMIENWGLDQARRAFTRFGAFWGEADAGAMKRIFKWDNLSELLMAGPRMHALQGVTRPVVTALRVDKTAGRFNMQIMWHDSIEAQEHVLATGESDKPACWILTGYMSGYASFCFGKNVYFVEHKCRAKGDRVCSATGNDIDSWGKEIQAHLPYFSTEDIHSKVLRLTDELKEKDRELERHRRQLMQLERAAASMPAEVRSESFRKVLDMAGRVAPYDSSILITGESGVGKEVLARYVHGLSRRAEASFVAVNCAALPETLLESELFGHRAGSFTGATENRAGLFEQAQKGTIFLDEIGDVSPAIQMKLLRVLQEREILRVGESRPRKVDIRVIAATNHDLENAIRNGTFREDLYYRLRVIEIDIPPLRDRPEDLLPLARYFVKQMASKLGKANLRLDATSLDHLSSYPWPGNVRELENALERAAVLCREEVIKPEDLPRSIVEGVPMGRSTADDLKRSLAEVESEHIRAVLESVDGSRTRATKILGISPATLWRKLKQD